MDGMYEGDLGECDPEPAGADVPTPQRLIRIADGPFQGACVGKVVNRQLHRSQKPNHWLRRGKNRFMTMDAATYRANRAAWDLLVVRDLATDTLFVLPASRFDELAFEMRTPSGMQVGVVDRLWMSRVAYRDMTLFEFIPQDEWGTSRRVRATPYALDAGEAAADRLLNGEDNEPLYAEFLAHHEAHPDKFIEFVTCAYFAMEMGWDADAMSELLGLIAVDNNYRSRYRRMLVNLDAELGPLVRVGGLKTK